MLLWQQEAFELGKKELMISLRSEIAQISLQTYSQQIDAAINSEDNLVVRTIAEVIGRAEFVDEGI